MCRMKSSTCLLVIALGVWLLSACAERRNSAPEAKVNQSLDESKIQASDKNDRTTGQKPCSPESVTYIGYVHPTVHGAWVSKDAGINGAGVIIILDKSSQDPGLKQLADFLRNVAGQQSRLFRGHFSGTIICTADDRRRLLVQRVEKIEVSQVRNSEIRGQSQ